MKVLAVIIIFLLITLFCFQVIKRMLRRILDVLLLIFRTVGGIFVRLCLFEYLLTIYFCVVNVYGNETY